MVTIATPHLSAASDVVITSSIVMPNPPSYITTYHYSGNKSFYHAFIQWNQFNSDYYDSHEDIVIEFHFKPPYDIMR